MKYLFLVLAWFVCLSNSNGQGTIRGKVTDDLGESVPGVSIAVKDIPTLGARTDFDGNYSLKISDATPHILIVSFYGYQTQEVSVNPNDGEVTILNFDLVPEISGLAVVEIEAKATKAKDYYMEKMKQKSATTLDYISSETIKKTGD